MSVELFGLFLQSQLGITPEDMQFERGDPLEVYELLMAFETPLKAPVVARFLSTAEYDPSGEAIFDMMMERLAVEPYGTLTNDGDAAITVWQERVTQAQLVLTANVMAQRLVVIPPRELDLVLRQVAAGILWLHRMELPFPAGSGLAAAVSNQPAIAVNAAASELALALELQLQPTDELSTSGKVLIVFGLVFVVLLAFIFNHR